MRRVLCVEFRVELISVLVSVDSSSPLESNGVRLPIAPPESCSRLDSNQQSPHTFSVSLSSSVCTLCVRKSCLSAASLLNQGLVVGA